MNGLLLGIVGNALGSRFGQLKRRKHREQADGALALGIARTSSANLEPVAASRMMASWSHW